VNSLIDRIVRYYKYIAIIIIICTLPFGYFYTKQRYFNHVNMFFEKDDPAIVFYKQFQEQFGNDEIAAIVFKADDIFTQKNIRIIQGISRAAKSMDGVETVMSLTEEEIPKGNGDTVDFLKLVPDDMELNDANLETIRKECMAHPLVVGNLISKDGTTTAIMIELAPIASNELKKDILNTLRDKAEQVAGNNATLYYSGGPYLEVEIEGLTTSDNTRFTPITFFIIIFVVYMMLRNFTLSILGQINVSVTVIWGIGFLIMCGESINTVTVIIAPVLLAISIADSIHILSYYKECYRKNGGHHKEAVAEAAKTLWFPCLFTSMTTGIGYLSFVTTTVRPVKIVGIFTSIGVMTAFIMTIVFLPTLMMVFRKRIEKGLDLKKQHTPIFKKDYFMSVLVFLGENVTRHYKIISVFFLLITIITSLGILKLRFETDFVSYLKDDNKIKQDIRFIEDNIRGTVPVEVVFEATSPQFDFTHPESLKLIEKIQIDVMDEMSGRFTTSFSVADYIKEINRAFNEGNKAFDIIPDNPEDVVDYFEIGDESILKRLISPDRMKTRISFASCFGSTTESKSFTHYMDNHVKPLLGDRMTYTFTGLSALYITMDKNLKISQARSFGSAFVLIFIMMFFLCKNVKLTVISMIPNLFPIFVTLGIMGWLDIPLDGSTIMIASVTIGIAVDDTIHFITWFRRNSLAGMDTQSAVIKTFKDTGKPIVMTSIILCIAYCVLITGSVKPIIAFGALAGLAMFFALLGDLFILPSLILVFKPAIRSPRSTIRPVEAVSNEKKLLFETMD